MNVIPTLALLGQLGRVYDQSQVILHISMAEYGFEFDYLIPSPLHQAGSLDRKIVEPICCCSCCYWHTGVLIVCLNSKIHLVNSLLYHGIAQVLRAISDQILYF